MKVFVTGATGWIGAATVDELAASGHEVLGLARSDDSAKRLDAKNVSVLRGDLDDLDMLRAGVATTDAVVHLANKHDWANPAVMNAAERTAVQAIAEALVGSDRPFLFASGLAGLTPGRPARETDRSPAVGPDSMRGGAENLAMAYLDKGVHAVSVRFAPTVHGPGDWGFVSNLVAAATRHGAAGYLGSGDTLWSAVHRGDAARLIRLGLERAPAGAILHAVAEESLSMRAIAAAIGAALELPVTAVAAERATEHFGFVGRFVGADMAASSAATRALLGWRPTGPTLAQDLRAGAYTTA